MLPAVLLAVLGWLLAVFLAVLGCSRWFLTFDAVTLLAVVVVVFAVLLFVSRELRLVQDNQIRSPHTRYLPGSFRKREGRGQAAGSWLTMRFSYWSKRMPG